MIQRMLRARRCQIGIGFVLCLLWGSVRATESGSPPAGPLHLVHDFFPGDFEADQPPSQLTKLGNTLFFVAIDVETGQNVWRTDGTPGATQQVPLVGYDGAIYYPNILGSLGQRMLWTVSSGDPNARVLFAATEQGDGIALRTYTAKDYKDLFENVGGRFFSQDCTDAGCTIWSSDGTIEGTGPVPALATRFTAIDQEIVGTFADRWLVFRSQRGLFAYDVARKRTLSLLPDGVQYVEAYPVGESLFLLTNVNQLWVSRLESPRASLLFSRAALAVAGWRGSTLYFASKQGNLWSTEGRRENTRFYSGLGVEEFSVLADQLGALGSTTFLPMPGYYSASLLGVDESKRKVSELTHVCTGKYPCLDTNMSPVTIVGKLAFETIDGFLWQSDATPKGTKPHEVLAEAGPNTFRVFDGRLVLGATSVEGEQQLWETDGTVSGTRALSDGTLDQPFQVQGPPAQLAGALFVAASRKPVGPQLWRIANGQTTSITSLRHLGAGINPFFAVPVGNNVVLSGVDSGSWFWVTDHGSVEQLPVSEDGCTSFFDGPCPFEPLAVGQRLFFAQSALQEELWSTDGTLAGTGSLLGGLAALGKLGDSALILDESGYLTATDGSPEGSRFITQLWTDQSSQIRAVGPPLSAGPLTFLFRLVTVPDDSTRAALELWRTDGTAEGTLRLASISFDNNGTPYPNPAVVSGRLFFRFLGTLWKSDGSLEGTQPFPDQLPGGTFNLAAGTDTLYAAAGEFDDGQQTLWAINPATLAATLLGTFHQVAEGIGNPLGGVLSNALFFRVSDPQGVVRWWVTEGTPESTHQLPDPLASDQEAEFFTAGDRRYFSACEADHGCELWSTDRLGEDTRMVEDLWPGPRGSDPQILAVTSNAIFLAATEPTVGRELWKLDLSAAAASATPAKNMAPSRPLVSRPRDRSTRRRPQAR
jgi:ELWxxDGT repeat protein